MIVWLPQVRVHLAHVADDARPDLGRRCTSVPQTSGKISNEIILFLHEHVFADFASRGVWGRRWRDPPLPRRPEGKRQPWSHIHVIILLQSPLA